jgi:hypothetical protein
VEELIVVADSDLMVLRFSLAEHSAQGRMPYKQQAGGSSPSAHTTWTDTREANGTESGRKPDRPEEGPGSRRPAATAKETGGPATGLGLNLGSKNHLTLAACRWLPKASVPVARHVQLTESGSPGCNRVIEQMLAEGRDPLAISSYNPAGSSSRRLLSPSNA